MNVDRCPSCGGAVRPGAPWCQLCYASLTDSSSPVLMAADAVETSARAELSAALMSLQIADGSLADTYSDTLLAEAPPLPEVEDEPAGDETPVVRQGWPCALCQTVNDYSVDMCTTCGAMFLPPTMPSLSLPVVGDLSSMGKGRRTVIALLAALLFTGFFVFLGALAGQLI